MNYPQKITQSWLDSQKTESDICNIRIELHGCYNYRPVPVAGKGSKRYLFERDKNSNCHVLNVPSGVWMADNGEMASNIMLAPFSNYRLLILVEQPRTVETQKVAPEPEALPEPPSQPPAGETPDDKAKGILGRVFASATRQ